MVSGNQQPTVEQDQSELAELRDGQAKLTPKPRPNPPQIMAPMPLPQGPHARTDADGLLWVSEDRRAALLRAEKADAADDWTRADTAPPTAGSVVMARAALIHEAEMKAQAEARDAWVERQKAAEAEGRKRGVERMRRGINSWRDSIERKGDQ